MSEETRDVQLQEALKQEITEGPERTRARVAFVPRVDIYDASDAIILVADMPGVDEQAVDITLERNVLTINGYVEPCFPENYSLAYAEYRVGDFERSFKVSDEIDQDKIEATLKNGVLRLRLPKAQPTLRKIAVQGA